jgi:hypothetical protein
LPGSATRKLLDRGLARSEQSIDNVSDLSEGAARLLEDTATSRLQTARLPK